MFKENDLRQKLFGSYFIGTAIFLLGSLQGGAQGVSPEQNYAANSPGVVMVQTVFSGTVYVNKVEMNEGRFQQLVDSVKKLDTTGTMFSAEEKLDIVVKALYNRPLRYLSATTEYFRQQHRIVSTGTGFFATGDGYLLTNCHNIDRDSVFIRRQFILSTYEDVTAANIRSLQGSWDMTLTDEQRNLLNNAYSVIYAQVSSMIIFDLKKEIFVQFRVDNGDESFTTRRMPARVIIKGKPMPGKDVAILKIDSVQQVPTLAISKDSIARIGEQVYVYGYPEPVTSNAFLARETGIEPTLTAGIVSAIKRSKGGWPVIQTDAVITHGSSGSPVCNGNGEVIGVATFGSLEQNTGSLAAGFNFAIPLSVVREFLDSIKLSPVMSDASYAFNTGLDFYYKGYYRKALQKFLATKKLNVQFPLVNYHIRECNRKIAAGLDSESSMKQFVFRVLAVLFIVGGVFVFYRWKKKLAN
ncbi:MAG TPA: trypsin-like peptidase domain-containing protein [Chitinophagaceae bacterium]|nr:trypsin-like peptidase domain-containing protein [Chitinophagaceae bacterium]